MRSPPLIAVSLLVCARSLAFADEPPEPDDDAPTGSFQVGAGFSSDEHFIATAGVAQDDLFDTGQRLALTAELLATRQDLRLRHAAPDVFDSGLTLSTELFATRRQYTGFAREGLGGAVTLSQQVDRATRAYVRYRGERVAIDAASPAARLAMAGPDLGGVVSALGAGVEYDTLDARLLPRAGTRFLLDAEVADRRLGSDAGLVRVTAALDHARALGPFTLRVQGRAGYVRGRGGDPVPLFERYQHDGHGDVRGYPMGSFGDRELAGGFDGEALGRVELELPVIRSAGLSVAGWADAGAGHNADPRWGPTGTSVHRSVGVSVIWRSPIGPLRFDWAIPLDGGDRDRPQFLFGFGGSF